jgi:hypothetical protein
MKITRNQLRQLIKEEINQPMDTINEIAGDSPALAEIQAAFDEVDNVFNKYFVGNEPNENNPMDATSNEMFEKWLKKEGFTHDYAFGNAAMLYFLQQRLMHGKQDEA